MNNNVWHPTEDGQYWFNQGMAHIQGTRGKRVSMKDAVRCFKNGMEAGDNACAQNYALLISRGYVDCEDEEIYPILKDLVEKGLIEKTDESFMLGDINPMEILYPEIKPEQKTDKSLETMQKIASQFPSGLELKESDGDDLIALKLRKKIERKLFSRAKQKGMTLISLETGKKVGEAHNKGIISYKTAEKFSEICRYCGKMLHDPPETNPKPKGIIIEWIQDIDNS